MSRHYGPDYGREALEIMRERIAACPTRRHMVLALADYAEWNARFCTGVVALTAAVSAAADAFLDDEELEIAKFLFYAAVDEYGTGGPGVTHRTLAKHMVRTAAKWVMTSPRENDAPTMLGWDGHRKEIDALVEEVMAGYGVGGRGRGFFHGMGFHLGSETLADQEFNALDHALSDRFPDLVAYLRATPLDAGGRHYNAYSWVRFHTSVEEQHRDYAVDAINRALSAYRGGVTLEVLERNVQEGLSAFAATQRRAIDTIFDWS